VPTSADRPLALELAIEQSGEVRATVDVSLRSSSRPFSLPSSGTRSLMFRFGDALLGGILTSSSDQDFEPGGEYRDVTLDLWDDSDTPSIAIGSSFIVWYGEDVGEGSVKGLAMDA
jgi:hypothetical protein